MDAKCATGTTALMHAASTGNLEIIKFLHNSGVDVQETTGVNGWTALTIAARSGQMDVLKVSVWLLVESISLRHCRVCT